MKVRNNTTDLLQIHTLQIVTRLP